MKHIRLFLILLTACLLLPCLVLAEEPAEAPGAIAAEEPAEEPAEVENGPMVIDGFTVSTMDDGCYIISADASLIRDGVLILPEELDGKRVYGFYPSLVSDELRMLIRSCNTYCACEEGQEPDSTLQYRVIVYAGFKNLSTNQLDRVPDMKKGEYALTEFYTESIARNGSVNGNWDGILYEEEIPAELFGQSVYNLIPSEQVAKEEGSFSYIVYGDSDKYAAIIRCSGEAGSTLVVPEQLGGVPVKEYRLSALPEGTETVYTPYGCYFNQDRAFTDEGRELRFLNIRYISYEQAEKNQSSLLSENPGFTGNQYAYTDITRDRYTGSESYSDYIDEAIPEETLLKEINGKPVILGYIRDRVAVTEGEWTYTVSRGSEDYARILGYNGEALTVLVIPRTLGGARVDSISLSAIPETVETIYRPSYCDIRADEVFRQSGRSVQFVVFRYTSYEQAVRDDEWLIKNYPDIAEGTVIISEINVFKADQNNATFNSNESFIPAETVLSEIDGMPVVTEPVSRRISRTDGDWVYYLESSGQERNARIIGWNGTAGKVLVIPYSIGGYPVNSIWISAIPEEAEYVYRPYSCQINNDDNARYSGKRREMMFFRYISYEQAKTDNDYYISQYPAFTEGTYALYEISAFYAEGDKTGSDNDRNRLVPVEEILTEIDGKTLINQPVSRYLACSLDGFTYTVDDNGESATVLSAPASDRENSIFLPRKIGDLNVRYLNAATIPENITEIIMPTNSSLNNSSQLSHDIKVYKYKDYETIRENDNYSDRYCNMQPGELALYEAYRYTKEGKSERLQQDYFDYPTSVNGQKLLYGLYGDEYVTVYTSGMYTYYKLSDKEICICKYSNDEASKVEIPEQLDGLTVAGINSLNYNTVFNTSKATEIKLPGTLRILGDNAIYSYKMNKLTLPEGLEEIGSGAVSAYRVNKITIPSSVTSIGRRAIYCRANELVIPDGIRTLPEGAFSNTYYRKIVLPSGLQVIPKEMCSKCNYLTSIVIPDSVTEIGSKAFEGCERLTGVTLPASLTTIGESAFIGCTRLSSVTFTGDKLKKIADFAFVECGLTKVKLSEGIEEIGNQAFSSCTKLQKIELPHSALKIGDAAFSGCSKLTQVTLFAGVTEIAENAFNQCGKKMTFFVEDDSYAKSWAESRGHQIKKPK